LNLCGQIVLEQYKNLILLIAIIIAGYFLYQNLPAPASDDGKYHTGREISDPGNLPAIPKTCRPLAKKLKKTIYGAATHEISFAKRNRISHSFAKCLIDAGFSEEEIQNTIEQIEDEVDSLLQQDGY
jgi:hypothetical protein